MSIRITGRILPSGRLSLGPAPPSFATISHVGSISTSSAQNGNVSLNCQVGDVAFAIVSGEIAITQAAGWTNIYNIAIANQFSQRFAYRVCNSTTVSLGSWQFGQLAYLAVYRGVNTTSPIGLSGGGSPTGSFVFPSLGPFATNSWAIATGSNRTGSSSPLGGNSLNNDVVTRRNNGAAFPPNLFYGDTNGPRASWNSVTVSSIGVCLSRVYELRAASI